MTDTNQTLTLLWHAIVYCIQHLILYIIPQFPQLFNYQIKIPLMASQNVCNILKHEQARLYAPYSVDEYRKSIPSIFYPLLIAETAERLAGRTAYDNADILYIWIFKPDFKKLVMTISCQVTVVSLCRLTDHFKANCFEPCGFKPQ